MRAAILFFRRLPGDTRITVDRFSLGHPAGAHASSVTRVNSDGGRHHRIVWIAALLCGVVAIGAALQGTFRFTGPRWIIGFRQGGVPAGISTQPPVPRQSQHPGSIHASHELAVQEAALVTSLAIVAVCLAAFLIWRWLRNRRDEAGRGTLQSSHPPVIDEALDVALDTTPDLPTLRRGLTLAADALRGDGEPRDAIVRAWIGLQEAAKDSGMERRPAETPTEFTTRVFETVKADESAARILLELYLRVRFGSRPATDHDVERARQAIAALTATWPESQQARR